MDISVETAFATGAVVKYYTMPSNGRVNSLDLCVSADPGDAETVTLAKEGTTIGVATFGTDIAAGAVSTYAKDTSNGDMILAKGDVVTLTTSAAAAANVSGYINLDVAGNHANWTR